MIIALVASLSLLAFITVALPPAHAATGATGGIALCFDDQNVADWYAARPMFDQYNVKATFFVTMPQYLDSGDVTKLLALQSDGMEIACHGLNHINAYQYVQTHTISNYIATEITPAITALTSLGFHITDFAWPYGAADDSLDNALLPYFSHLRYTSWPANTGDPLKNYNNGGVFYKFDGNPILFAGSTDNIEGIPLQQFYDALDLAYANGWVLVTYGHQIKETTSKDYITQTSKLQAIIQYAASKGMKFYTVSQLQGTSSPTPTPTPTATPTPTVTPTPTATPTPTPAPGTITVGPTGNYNTIQAAVDAASAGSTILVSSGTYVENVNIGKSLTLKADSGATPIVDANKKDAGIRVQASNVWVEGFTVQNGGPSYYGIYVAATGASIVNNKISGCGYGIYLTGSSGCTLKGNTVTGATANGICLINSKSNVVTTSTTSGNKVGLAISGTSTGNAIYRNDFLDPASAVSGNSFNTPAKQIYIYKGKQYTNFLGNYWSGYKGIDGNGNGLGDTFYTSGAIKDTVPLMASWTSYT